LVKEGLQGMYEEMKRGISMRSEREMFALILSVANRDNRIKAVYMNGSRANTNVKKDILDDKLWNRLMSTFNMGDYDSAWSALITTCELFKEIFP
jgi:hypothetical protein